MDKDELKEAYSRPTFGLFGGADEHRRFLLLLYGITVVVRFLFALGSAWVAMAYTSRQTTFSGAEGGALPSLPCGAFRQGGAVTCGFALPCLMCVS